MPTYDFLCDSCGTEIDKFMSISATYKENWDKIECPNCRKQMHQTFRASQTPIFREGQGEESSKPGSYWRSAEKNRLKEQRKRLANEREKLGDRDPQAIKEEIVRQQHGVFEDFSPES